MEAGIGSVTQFFYNVLPGAAFFYFLIVSDLVDPNKVFFVNDGDDKYFILVTLLLVGSAFGFIFQGLTKVLRELFKIDIFVMKRVKNVDSIAFDKALKKFRLVNKNISDNQLKSLFYTMDCVLRANKKDSTVYHFSSRFAFWSNILVGYILFILFYCTISQESVKCEFIIACLAGLFSIIYICYLHLFALYDVVLKTYSQLKEI